MSAKTRRSIPYGRICNFQKPGIVPQWCFWKGPETGIDHDHWAGTYPTQAQCEFACRAAGLEPNYPPPPDPNLPWPR